MTEIAGVAFEAAVEEKIQYLFPAVVAMTLTTGVLDM